MCSQQNKINSLAAENVESPTKTPLPYIPTYQRTGCMAAFESFAQFEQYFDEILDTMEELSTSVYVSPKIIDALESGSESRSLSASLSLSDPRPVDQENLQVVKCEIHIILYTILANKFFFFLDGTLSYSMYSHERYWKYGG